MNVSSLKKGGLALAAGAALALSMPGFSFGPLSLIGLVPLFFALERKGGFGLGFIAGLAFFAIDLRWLLTLSRFNSLVLPGYLAVACLLAVYHGLFGAIAARVLRRQEGSWRLLILAPVAYTGLEILRTFGPIGNGFSALYQSFYRFPEMIQLAAYLGPWSISLAIVLVNACIYLAAHGRRIFLVCAFGVIGLLLLFALLPVDPGHGRVTVSVASSDVSQEVKMDGRNLDDLLDMYIALGKEAAEADPDLIVFPESILPVYILRDGTVLGRFADLARQAGSRILFGTGDMLGGEIFNSTVLLSPSGGVLGTYRMVRPVPFGEYIPGRRLLEHVGLGGFVASLLPKDLTRGTGFFPIEEIGTPICFESTMPEASRSFSARGSELIVTVTNDAWFGGSSELQSHFAAGVFRAVENRRCFAQAANGGISGFIDSRGRIVDERLGEGVLTSDLVLSSARSTYTRVGDWPVYFLLLAFGLGFAVREAHAWISGRVKRDPSPYRR